MQKMSSQIDVTDALRIIAFFVGLVVFVSGLSDFSQVLGSDVAIALSLTGTGFLKVVFGAFFMLAGINPDAVVMVINVILRK
jgi:hypothetical protein